MEQKKCQFQTIEQTHSGPFHRYMWKERVSKFRAYEHFGVLCEKCAKELGAWQLPEQKRTIGTPEEAYTEALSQVGEEGYTQYYFNDGSLDDEEGISDDTPQPNNNLSGNPYR